MAKRRVSSSWPALFHRHVATLTRTSVRAGSRSMDRALEPLRSRRDDVTDFKARGVTRATLVQVGCLGHAWSGGAQGERFSDGNGPDARAWCLGFASRQFSDRV